MRNLVFLCILGIAAFLRFYKLSSLMQFIPDQGWFYLSARDTLLTGQIPLVGPPTSHPWIHHGPLWTYTLGILLWLFNFNPVMPAYFIALLGVATVGLFYFFLKKMYSQKVAILSSLLFATSPIVVMNSRIPYHTSPIPFFVILLFFLTYLWIKGKAWTFPLITFLLAVLYNHEITTFVYAFSIFLIFIFGIVTKKKWVKNLKHVRIILLSILGFLIPMIPFITHDVTHGYRQTFGFLAWMLYRVAKLPLSFFDSSFHSSGSNPSTIPEFLSYYKDLIFAQSIFISTGILMISILGCAYLLIKYEVLQKICSKRFLKLQFPIEYVLLALFLSIGSVGLFVHRVPIEADVLLISPFVILTTILVLTNIVKKSMILFLIVPIIAISNSYFLISTNFYTENVKEKRISQTERLRAVSEIISLSEGQKYNIVGKGALSDFPVFTMPYEYLLWWKGYPVDKSSKTKIIIWEQNGKIEVYKND